MQSEFKRLILRCFAHSTLSVSISFRFFSFSPPFDHLFSPFFTIFLMVFTYQSKYRRQRSSSSRAVSSSKTASSSKTGGSISQSQAKGKGKNRLRLPSPREDADSDEDDLNESDTGDEPIVLSKQQLMGSSLRDWASSRLSKLGKGDDETRRMVLGLTGLAPMASVSPSDSSAIPLSSPVRKAYEETNHGLKGARKGSLSKSSLKGKGKSKKVSRSQSHSCYISLTHFNLEGQ